MTTPPPEIAGIARLVACWSYEGAVAEAVRALKYGRATALVTRLADGLALVAPAADVVTWVPCSPARRRRRGFDPGEMLARALARRRGIRVVGVLRRLDHRPQTVRSREGRYRGPTLRLRVRTAHRVRGRRVLLVDDVCTTGSSLRAAAAALRTGGASEVVAAVVALAGTNRRPNEEVVALQ